MDKITNLVEETAKTHACFLYDIKWIKSKNHLTLRVLIDKDKGVTLLDCEKISKSLNVLLDVEEDLNKPYSLEVSSPGLDRDLTKFWHFKHVLKEEIFVQKPGESIKGILVEVDEKKEAFKIQTKKELKSVFFKEIKKAKKVFKF